MDTQLVRSAPSTPRLELDLIGDLICPWSFVGKRSLERALASLYGAPVRVLRWHGLPRERNEQGSWGDYFAGRLPGGAKPAAERERLEAQGRELGIDFAFDRLRELPDTREAHRLVSLAAREGRQTEVIDALFRAFLEHGRDLADPAVLADVIRSCQLGEPTTAAFADSAQASEEVAAEERRMRSLGIEVVPNVLINGRVLVPGPADVPTYVQALDQALFPELKTPRSKRLLH
jgi:predicted DsbA family dithiol-disulfide isomerase